MIRHFSFRLGFFLALVLIWFFFRSGGYKRDPLDAPARTRVEIHRRTLLDPHSGDCSKRGTCPAPASAPMFGRGGTRSEGPR